MSNVRSKCHGWGVILALAASVTTAGQQGALPVEDVPLVEAVKRGDTGVVSALLRENVDVNAQTVDGATALHWAVHRDSVTMVERLLREGADASAANRYGVTPLSLACENGNALIIDRLLQAGADPNVALPGGETALMTAARTGNPDAVKVLLRHGADANAAESTRRQTALMWAASNGNEGVIELLVDAGADINARSSESKPVYEGTFVAGRSGPPPDLAERIDVFTPLLFAVRAGRGEAVRTLLEAGADINDTGPNGTSPLVVACINAHWELASLLLDLGADPNAAVDGWSALHQVVRTRSLHFLVRSGGLPPPASTGTLSSVDLARKLIAHGATLDAPSKRPGRGVAINQSTPLMLAARPADPEMVRLLIAAGSDPLVTLPDGTTLVMAAAGVGTVLLVGDDEEALEVARLGLSHGIDVNAVNDAGNGALHGAAFRGFNPLVQLLVDEGAGLDVKNRNGWTPLMTAHADYRGMMLQSRPETEALLRELMEERGVPARISDLAMVLYRQDKSPRLDFWGSDVRSHTTAGDTQWVNYKPSPFSSPSMAF